MTPKDPSEGLFLWPFPLLCEFFSCLLHTLFLSLASFSKTNGTKLVKTMKFFEVVDTSNKKWYNKLVWCPLFRGADREPLSPSLSFRHRSHGDTSGKRRYIA